MPPRPERLSALDLVEGLQLGHAVATLHDLGVLASLVHARTAEEVAGRFRLDPRMLHGMLTYTAARTRLVRRKGRRFVATPGYATAARFLLDLYGLAFGSNAEHVAMLLRKPKRAAAEVDRARHARAFAAAGAQPGPLAAIVRHMGLNYVLDLGCGAAGMLADLARQDRHFVGWGLERNPAMCRAARRNIRAARAASRVRIFEGDATRVRTSLHRDSADHVRAVTASQLANELFDAGPSRVVRWLRDLRSALPNRPLIIADYYGRLGTADGPREVLLHDYVQVISGQGVPPPNLAGWNAIYTSAGCRLMQVFEDSRTTLFVHAIAL